MSIRWLLLLSGLFMTSGCLYHAQEHADHELSKVVGHPFDPSPPEQTEPLPQPAKSSTPPAIVSRDGCADRRPDHGLHARREGEGQQARGDHLEARSCRMICPGAESPLIQLPKDPGERRTVIRKLYPVLPPLPEGPLPQPGPDGQPYTLAMLQNIAAANSPTLRQAAANVEQARGNMLQAGAYPNPTVGYVFTPSNDGSTPGLQGPFFDQVIQTIGQTQTGAGGGREGPGERGAGPEAGPQRPVHRRAQCLLRRAGRQGNGPRQSDPVPLHR